ncbi:hypothetical protein D3C80_2001460 [compost metagenome]
MIESFLSEECLSFVCQDEINLIFLQTFPQLLGHQSHDFANMLLFERVEDDNFVNPVQKFRTEALLELFHYFALHIVIISPGIIYCCESKSCVAFDRLSTNIGC